jgi:cell division GTPase FtsZ
VADAVFLVDNQRFVKKGFSIRNNLGAINSMIAEPFYNVLCAGEEKQAKYIGSKILDAGDIIRTLEGWTAIGHGKSQIPRMKFILDWRGNFRDKAAETHKGIQAMDEAVGELSLPCNPKDAGRALYLLSAPAKEMDVELVKELGLYVKGIAPEAEIRTGDYPRERDRLSVSLILSDLKGVGKLMGYFTKTIEYISALKRKKEGIDYEQEKTFKDIPVLL